MNASLRMTLQYPSSRSILQKFLRDQKFLYRAGNFAATGLPLA
jgi:hypothetical protein